MNEKSWALILFVTIDTARKWKNQNDALGAKDLYKNQEFLLQVFQTAALLEVLHAAVGLVRSNAMLVLFQVLSRLLVVWIVMFMFEPVCSALFYCLIDIFWFLILFSLFWL